MKACITLSLFLLLAGPVGMALGQTEPSTPTWRRIRGNWPETTNQVRSMIGSKGELYVGTAGTVAGSAQVWKLVDGGWMKHAEFDSLKAAVLQADAEGNLFVGTGTPHSAETRGKGHAEVWKIDRTGKKKRLRAFPELDIAYCMAWFQGKLHVGLMAEDLPGRAAIWRFDDPGWTRIAGGDVNGWPVDNSYAGVYELSVHDGALIAGTFSRTMGDGDVLKFDGDRWSDLAAPRSILALSFANCRGHLVGTFSNAAANLRNPVFSRQTDGTWKPLGTAPAEWKGAYIHNHMIAHGNELYVGVGGKPGTLSVWKWDGVSWTKLAGDGLHGSWVDPLVSSGAEWVYRLTLHRGNIYAGLASDRSPFRAQVWEMTP